jgi:hypothetical protein
MIVRENWKMQTSSIPALACIWPENPFEEWNAPR